MALLQTGTLGNGSPKMYYELYADNVSASGNNKTVRVTIKVKVNGTSASSFGYPVNWRARLQTPHEFKYGNWATLKGSEFWYGSDGLRTYSQDITFDGKTTASVVCIPNFEISSSSSSWNGSSTHASNFGTLSSNTPPYWPSGSSLVLRNGSASGEILKGTIPENVSKIYASWSVGKDNEGGTLRYGLNVKINGASSGTNLYLNTGRNFTHTIGSGNEGQTLDYYVDMRDNQNALSSAITHPRLTKNKFTQATLASTSTINFDTGKINFSYSGAKNTNGNTSFTYKIACSEVTVYNQDISGGSTNIAIYKNGDLPTTPYIKFEDIKEKFRANSFQGVLNFTLTTTNAYGTSKTSGKAINVDLRTEPDSVTCSISNDKTLSTCIKTTADTGANYYIPNGSDIVRVGWSGGSCKLGSVITYDVQVKFGSGAFTTIATKLPSTTNFFNYQCPKQSSSKSLTFRIITRTEFDYTSYKDTSSVTLHYYNSPIISVETITRTDSAADINLTVKTNSSIPNINTVGSWKMSTTNQTGNLTQSQSQQTINVTGLTSNGTYTLSVTYNDGTGFTTNATHAISIGANLPVFQINKYGAGVCGAQATSTYSLNVKGRSYFSDGLVLPNNIGIKDSSGRNFLRSNGTATVLSAANDTIYFRPQGDTSTTNHATLSTSGVLNAPNIQVGGKNVYHTGRKPSAADVGALSVTGGVVDGNIEVNTITIAKYPEASPENETGLARLIVGNNDWNGSAKVQLGDGADKVGFEVINKEWTKPLLAINCAGELKLRLKNFKGSAHEYTTLPASGAWQNFLPTVANDGVMEIGKYIDFHNISSTADFDVRLYGDSGKLTCSGTFAQGSDRALKENIHYIDEDYSMFANVKDANKNQFKDFIKNDLKVATYNYKNVDDTVIGFIAQDIYDNDIAKLFVKEVETDEGTMLNFDLSGYTTIVAKALQEEIIEKDKKIEELENRLKLIEEKLNI